MQYKSTIGADFQTKELNIEGNNIKMLIWDTPNAETFLSMGASFYRNSDCCVLVFDLTNRKSFESIESLRNEFCMF